MDDRSSMSPGMAWAMALVCLAVGLTPILQVAGFLPIAHDSSRWLMVGVGGLFIAGGASLVAGYGMPRGDRPSRLLAWIQYALALIVTALMATSTAWVAFAPGERRFGTNVPFLSGAVIEFAGRVAFGAATVILCAVLVMFAILGARGLRARGDST
jgi:hypothetical protein